MRREALGGGSKGRRGHPQYLSRKVTTALGGALWERDHSLDSVSGSHQPLVHFGFMSIYGTRKFFSWSFQV